MPWVTTPRRLLLSLAPLTILLALSGSISRGAQSLLPQSFAGWTASQISKLQPSDIERIAGENVAILREYGLNGAEQATYQNPSHSGRSGGTLIAVLYNMHDPSAAYGAYSFLRSPDMVPGKFTAKCCADQVVKLGPRTLQHSAISNDRALFLEGNLLLEVSGSNVRAEENSLESLAALVAQHADHSPYPSLTQNLPTEGLVAGSERYFLGPLALNRSFPGGRGDWVGFGNGAEAELARYKMSGRDLTLLLVDYPTPQSAAQNLRQMGQQFHINNGGVVGKPELFARRNLTLVALVSGAESQPQAQSLLSRVKSNTQLTWNEPSFSLTQPGIGPIVVGTIIGSGILCLFALVAGLAFGGVRMAIKRLLPGKVFDRATTMEVLQLGLSSKPIEAKDFYGWTTKA